MNRKTLDHLLAVAAIAAAYLVWDRSRVSEVAGRQADAVFRIATKPMAEQFVLAEMIALLVEKNTDLQPVITKGIGGGTANIHPALIKGEFDMYPEYTGTAWAYVLKKTNIPDDATLYRELEKEYAEQYNLEWVGLYGFNNTFGLALRNNWAEPHNIRTYSDLAALAPELTFGAEYDFYEREDGYDALCAAYGLEFKKHVDIDIGLKYTAINAGQIDAMNVSTTDGRIPASEIRLLKDDKHFYNTYYCGSVVRGDVLAAHPELRTTLMLMDGLLTETDMARLNYLVEVENKDEREVAADYLRSKGLLERQ